MRSRLTYANVVATLALCLALGGGSAYAAVKLARNSVGSKQIRNHSVALKDLARSITGGAGANGANGLQGPKGDRGPAGPAGAVGAAGAAGQDLSFNGVRLGKLEFHPGDKIYQNSPEIPLGKVGTTDIVARCFTSNKIVYSQISLRRPGTATGNVLVYGGTDANGYKILKPGVTYDVDYNTSPGTPPANQWAVTVADPNDGRTSDVRGLVYRQYAAAPLVAPAADGCVLPQPQVEDVTR